MKWLRRCAQFFYKVDAHIIEEAERFACWTDYRFGLSARFWLRFSGLFAIVAQVNSAIYYDRHWPVRLMDWVMAAFVVAGTVWSIWEDHEITSASFRGLRNFHKVWGQGLRGGTLFFLMTHCIFVLIPHVRFEQRTMVLLFGFDRSDVPLFACQLSFYIWLVFEACDVLPPKAREAPNTIPGLKPVEGTS